MYIKIPTASGPAPVLAVNPKSVVTSVTFALARPANIHMHPRGTAIRSPPQADRSFTCRVIATGNYCTKTVMKLEDTIIDAISDAYQDSIDMSDESDAFYAVIGKACCRRRC